MGIPVEIVNEGIDWPAWVQAVGSVAAILVAIVVFRFERILVRKDRQDANGAFICLALGLAKQAVELARDTQAGLEQSKVVIHPDNFNDVIETLGKLPFDRMPSAEFALAYVNIRRGLRFYREAYTKMENAVSLGVPVDATGGLNTVLFNSATSIQLQYERLADEGANLGAILGARPDSELYRAIRAHNPGGSKATAGS